MARPTLAVLFAVSLLALGDGANAAPTSTDPRVLCPGLPYLAGEDVPSVFIDDSHNAVHASAVRYDGKLSGWLYESANGQRTFISAPAAGKPALDAFQFFHLAIPTLRSGIGNVQESLTNSSIRIPEPNHTVSYTGCF